MNKALIGLGLLLLISSCSSSSSSSNSHPSSSESPSSSSLSIDSSSSLSSDSSSISSSETSSSSSSQSSQQDEEIVYPDNPSFGSNVAVHDPSIFKDDDGKYYTFGSHFAVSTSTDLLHWSQFASDNQWQKLYTKNWKTVLADAFAHLNANPSSTWAPSVHKFGDKYYMYYSLSTFGSSVSYIGRVEADSVLGPYDNSVEIVKSDGSGGPNAIDPELFFDQDGKLWLVYGSFFDGIYIKEMYADGPNVGLPKESGYGKRLWQGSSNGPEGPVIFYNPDTEYYYLMASAASLSTNYNMRVVRSLNPDGPYLDISGIDVANLSNSGIKLAGNYQFDSYPTGYAALGHNSVLVEGGKYFAIYHSRYRRGTGVSGNHNQFVSQLVFNKDGWPLLAPNRYAGETLQTITAGDVVGNYDFLIHTASNSESFATSNKYFFNSEGKITGQNDELIGTWTLEDDYFISIKLKTATYEGVILPQWNNDLSKTGLSITAFGTTGLSLWANKN